MDSTLEPLQPLKRHLQLAANEGPSLDLLIDLNSVPGTTHETSKSTGLEKLVFAEQDSDIGMSALDNPVLKTVDVEPFFGLDSQNKSSSEAAVPGSLGEYFSENSGLEKNLNEHDVFDLVVPYCDIESVLNLALVSRSARIASTRNSIWDPICIDLGIRREQSSKEILLSSISPANVLDQGYVQDPLSPYKTFIRAFNELVPYLSPDKSILKDFSLTDRASVLGNAFKLSKVLDRQITDDLALHIHELEDLILAEISSASIKNLNDFTEVLSAASIFTEKFEDERLQRSFAECFFQHHKPSHNIDEFFTIKSDETGERRHASQLKIEKYFQAVASSLLAMKSVLKDTCLPIPISWKPSLWSFALTESLAAIVVCIQDILETAATDISELEYIMTVPKIYVAVRALAESVSMLEDSDLAYFDFATHLELSIMKPVLDEFCERQESYVDRYAFAKVKDWSESVSQRENETERFLWSSVPRKADKTNFITSLRWAFPSADASGDAAGNPNSEGTKDNDVPATELEAQTALLFSKLRGMESLVSLELAIDVLDCCRAAMHRLKTVGKANAKTCEPLFCHYLESIGKNHIQVSFEKAMKVLNEYDPKKYGRALIPVKRNEPDNDRSSAGSGTASDECATSRPIAVEPLAVFTELMSIGDIVQQMVHLFFEEELVASHIVRRGEIVAPSVNAKRKFEQMLDNIFAEGLSRGIDVMMEQVDFMLLTEQLGSDYCPLPTPVFNDGPTAAASKVIELVRSHLDLLRESTEKTLFDVFQQEVGVRLFSSLMKHLKRQIITTDGAMCLIADINAYHAFIVTLRQQNLLPYYQALKQVSQLYLIDTKYAKQIGHAIGDLGRYNGLMTTEDLVELVKRRHDWPLIKPKVEKVLYGIFECIIC